MMEGRDGEIPFMSLADPQIRTCYDNTEHIHQIIHPPPISLHIHPPMQK